MSQDCEIPEFWSERLRIARKQHKCCECRKPIEPGEKYAYIAMKYDGEMDFYKQHMRCWNFARHLNYDLGWSDDDGCVPFGCIGEEINARREMDDVYGRGLRDDEAERIGLLWFHIKNGFEFEAPPGSRSIKA